MRVALLQIRFDRSGVAANMQHINEVIDAAAGAEPTTDLLVLPGECDTGGMATRAVREAETCARMKANLSSKAREWGVYLAAGAHGPRDGAIVPYVFLIDPDGDTVIRDPGAAGTDAATVEIWSSSVGPMTVMDAAGEASPGERVAAVAGSSLVAVPVSESRLTAVRKRVWANVAAIADGAGRNSGAYWAVVCSARTESGPSGEGSRATFLCGPGGEILARADGLDESVVYADVVLDAARDGQCHV